MHYKMTLQRKMDLFFYLLGLLALMQACKSAQADPKGPSGTVCITDSLATIIRIDSVSNSFINDELKLSGAISFNENKVVRVFPFSSGQVIRVFASLGDRVKQGQLLAIIRSADIAGNYSDLASAENDLAIAKKQLDNTESLFHNGIASEKEFIEARENYQKAVAMTNKLKSQISINGKGQTKPDGTYEVKSPITGYVVDKKISQGAFIRSDNNENLFTIGDIGEVWVWANVYETDISKVKAGYPAFVSTLAYPGKLYEGVIDKLGQVLDPVTKVMKIRVKLPNPEFELKPDMFANILIRNKESKMALTMPSAALVSDNGKYFVILYRNKCDLLLREVQVIKTVQDRTYIAGGVQTGDRVISRNQILLYKALLEK